MQGSGTLEMGDQHLAQGCVALHDRGFRPRRRGAPL